ncbi:MAG: hypothetical protein CM1200mP17_07320 [Woeseia sp.]|nr:MAG: hypothetical protein CM1200mP17_07320 [Woeseia sp.]
MVKLRFGRGVDDEIDLVASKDVVKTITKGISKDIERRIDIFEPIIAPVDRNKVIGKLTVTYEGKVLAESSLYAKTNIEQDGLWGWLYDSALLLFE